MEHRTSTRGLEICADFTTVQKKENEQTSNYRGISLLSVPGKVFAAVTLNRCKEAFDKVMREEQIELRKTRRCTDQLFALRQIIEKALLYQVEFILCFIDFRATFNSIERDRMY